MRKERKKLIKQLEASIRKYILLRDGNRCVWCGKPVEKSNAHVSHIIPRSHGNRLKYNEYNLKLLCYHCHMNIWHKNPLMAAEWFNSKYPETYKYLQDHKEEHTKFTDSDIVEMIDIYEQKTRNFHESY